MITISLPYSDRALSRSLKTCCLSILASLRHLPRKSIAFSSASIAWSLSSSWATLSCFKRSKRALAWEKRRTTWNELSAATSAENLGYPWGCSSTWRGQTRRVYDYFRVRTGEVMGFTSIILMKCIPQPSEYPAEYGADRACATWGWTEWQYCQLCARTVYQELPTSLLTGSPNFRVLVWVQRGCVHYGV